MPRIPELRNCHLRRLSASVVVGYFKLEVSKSFILVEHGGRAGGGVYGSEYCGRADLDC